MKISIITACRNSEATIETAIRSVLEQSGIDLEYIIIDGASSDNTLRIIDRYRDRISKIISEKDSGIYFALNKGVSLATGDVVGLLHSDDFYSGPSILSKVINLFSQTGCDAVYGDLQYVDRNNTDKVIRNWKSGACRENIFLSGWMPPHPAFFVKRDCYNKYGLFNTDFKSAADYELMLRFIHKQKIKVSYLPEVIVKMRVGGKSNRTLLNRIKANLEDRKAWKVNGLKPGWLTLWLKPFSKLGQYF
jgi:glycosyltransferase